MGEASEEPDKDAEAPRAKLGSTATRLLSAIPVIVLVLWLLFWAPSVGLQIFALLWIAIASHELMNMALPGAPMAKLWGVASSVGLGAVVMFALDIQGALITAVIALSMGAVLFGLIKPEPIDHAARRIGWLMASPIYIGAPLASATLIHARERGGYWVMLTMFIAFLSDTFAYFAGRAFGKTKLAPLVSPKKTVEGALGGLLGSVAGAVGLSLTALDGVLPVWHAAILGLVAGALGQAGDLLESLIKRSCGVKDSGSIMPGHGGLLDRSDALIFTGATTYLYLLWAGPS